MDRRLPAQADRLVSDVSWRVRRPPSVLSAATGGALAHHVDGSTTLWPVALIDLGTLELDNGAVAVCDPYIADGAMQGFTDAMSPGPHDLILGVAEVGPGHTRNAFALILGTGRPIEQWRLAQLPDDSEVGLATDDAYYGFPVDAGTACIGSPSGVDRAVAVLAEDAGMLTDPLSTALSDSPHQAAIAAPSPHAEPVAVMTSGWGDGIYPTWLGLDEMNEVSMVVVDFLLNSEPPLPVDKPAARPPGLFASLWSTITNRP